jgi:opacity protein-like surface antigen
MGTSVGGSLIDDWLGHKAGYLTGFRLGWDADHYWGLESRLAFGETELSGIGAPTRAESQADNDLSLWYWDLDLLYYPWGDARWRPYWMIGAGIGQMTFSDRLDKRYSKTAFALPIALGVKYRCTDRLVLRAECTDNIFFAFDSHHNVSFTLGVELRFGGTQKSYWPWNPGRHYW